MNRCVEAPHPQRMCSLPPWLEECSLTAMRPSSGLPGANLLGSSLCSRGPVNGALHCSPLCCLGQSCDLSTERRLPHACELFSSALRAMEAASAQRSSADIPARVLRGALRCPGTVIPAGLGHRRGQREGSRSYADADF